MPFDRKKYPKDWEMISKRIRERAGDRCECTGQCGLHRYHPGPRRCTERNGEPAKYAKGRIVLTVAHLNHDTEFNEDSNLKALCQRCHLRYDADLHKKHAAETRRAKIGKKNLEMFEP